MVQNAKTTLDKPVFFLLLLLLIYLILPLIEVKSTTHTQDNDNQIQATQQVNNNNNRFKEKNVLYFCCNFSSQFCFTFFCSYFISHIFKCLSPETGIERRNFLFHDKKLNRKSI